MKIEVTPYRPQWASEFESEKDAILGAISDVALKVHHIGSTAVVGLAAKPIIDIMLEVRDLKELDECAGKIESLGYEALGELGIEGRRYFRKGRDHRTHQIHAFRASDPNLLRHLAFRDYLRNQPEVREEYEALKIKVASQCENDIDRYCEGKHAFITHHEAKALEWVKRKIESTCGGHDALPQTKHLR